jgi:hypothetical protein
MNRVGLGLHGSWNISLTGEMGATGPIGPQGEGGGGNDTNLYTTSLIITAMGTTNGTDPASALDGNNSTNWQALTQVGGADSSSEWGATHLYIDAETEGANTTISDISQYENSVTVRGDVEQSTEEVKFGNTSIHLENNGFLSVSDATHMRAGTQALTIEFWLNWFDSTGTSVIATKGDYQNNGWIIHAEENTTKLTWQKGEETLVNENSPGDQGATIGEWTHYAFVRTIDGGGGCTYTIYRDGVNTGSHTYGSTIHNFSSSVQINIGADTEFGSSGANFWTGWMEEFRMTIGTARYTEATPPPTGPYGRNSTDDSEWDNVVLLLPPDVSSMSFTDLSSYSHTITTNGNVQHSDAQAKWGDFSIYFDGDDDILELDDSDSWNFGSEDFTIEMWVRPTSNIEDKALISQSNLGANSDSSALIWVDNSAKVGIYLSEITSWDYWNQNTTALSVDQWYHIAAVRHNDTLRLYVNGESASKTTLPSNWTVGNSTRKLTIGGQENQSAYNFKGWMEGVRISKFARYTESFTPPSEAFSVGAIVEDAPCLKVDFGVNNAKTVKKYYIDVPTAGDASLTPRGWHLQGSDDGTVYKSLDTRMRQNIPTTGRYNFCLANTEQFRYYKMEFASGENPEPLIKISNLNLIG